MDREDLEKYETTVPSAYSSSEIFCEVIQRAADGEAE